MGGRYRPMISTHLAPHVLPPLSYLLDDLSATPAQAAHYLGTSDRTVRRWLADDAGPRAAMIALFWSSRWGMSQAHAEAHNLVAVQLGLAQALTRENAALRARVGRLAALDYGSANSPCWSIDGSGPSPITSAS